MAKNVLIEYLEQIFKLEKSVLAQQNYMKKVNQLFHDVNNTKLYQEKKSIQSRKAVSYTHLLRKYVSTSKYPVNRKRNWFDSTRLKNWDTAQ